MHYALFTLRWFCRAARAFPVNFEPVVGYYESAFLRNLTLQFFEFLIVKFNYRAAFDAEKMVVVLMGRPALFDLVIGFFIVAGEFFDNAAFF